MEMAKQIQKDNEEVYEKLRKTEFDNNILRE